MRVVDKLRMIVCELFSGDARLLNRLYAVSCGRFPAPVAMEDIIRVSMYNTCVGICYV